MRTVTPTISLVPGDESGNTTMMWIGYLIYDGFEIVEDHRLFNVKIPAIRQVGESEIAIMETIMDGADAVYHEMSRRIRRKIESDMRANSQRALASETLTEG